MFRCAIVVGLVFLLTMSKSESAPLMPVRTEQRGGATSGLGFALRSAAFRPFRDPNAVGQNAFRDPNGGKLASSVYSPPSLHIGSACNQPSYPHVHME